MENLADLTLLKIFSYLPLKKLKEQATTSKKWNILINETLKSRKNYIETILFNNQHDDNQCAQTNFITSDDFNTMIQTEISKLMIQPEFCLLFINPSFESHFNVIRQENRTKRKRLDVAAASIDHFKRIFSVSNGFLVSVPGIIGTDCLNLKTVEIDNELTDSLSGIIFPKSDYYRVVLKNIKNVKDAKLNEITDETISFVLILSRSFIQINKIITANNLNCPMSGGFVNDSYSIPCDKETTNLTFISLVTKDPDHVRIAQCIIPDCDKEDFDKIANEKLLLLQKTGIYSDKKNRTFMALQVTCCGKGKYFHGADNYESILFKKYFPNLKLAGFYANGEMGFDYLPNYNTDNTANSTISNANELKVLGFTTVFTILSIKI